MGEDSKTNLKSFNDFTKIPNFFYKSIGIEPYQEKDKERSWLLNIIFFLAFANLNLCVVGEVVYMFKNMGSFSSFLDVTAVAPCIGFCLVSDFKMLAVWRSKDILSNLMQVLKDMFPNTTENQSDFRAVEIERSLSMIMIPFAVLYMTLIWTFNLISLTQSAIEYLFITGEFVHRLPYLITIPFDTTIPWVYTITYVSECFAGYVAASGTLSADLLLCCIVMQIRMHFDYISSMLKKFNPEDTEKDYNILNKYIKHHIIMLELSEDLNVVFSISILFNFLTSSVILCFVGFNVTAGVGPLDLFKFFLFLVSSLIQVFLICYFGDMLIEASSNVGGAAYEHSWHNASIKYRKSILLVIQRAQKPAIIKATTFPPISLMTFTKVASMSYQFFAVLRTMYSEEH